MVEKCIPYLDTISKSIDKQLSPPAGYRFSTELSQNVTLRNNFII